MASLTSEAQVPTTVQKTRISFTVSLMLSYIVTLSLVKLKSRDQTGVDVVPSFDTLMPIAHPVSLCLSLSHVLPSNLPL